jgi:hypothetical protein
MALDQLDEEEDDYVEEKTTADGTHIRKEVHSGPGFTSVRITSDGGVGGDDMPPGMPAGLEEIMKAMMGGMANGPSPGGMIRIGGP